MQHIYALCPPYLKTGGPELIHQLVFTLNKIGGGGYVVYTNSQSGRYLHPSFEKYIDSYINAGDIRYNPENILIIPETMTGYIRKYESIRKYVWWLSVDNYTDRFKTPPKMSLADKFRAYGLKLFIWRAVKKLLRLLITPLTAKSKSKAVKTENFTPVPVKSMTDIEMHLVQSSYAYDFLIHNGIPESKIMFLSDYLNNDYIENAQSVNLNAKKNIVLYNPAKAGDDTLSFINYCPDIEFFPLKGLTNAQMIEKFSECKVYMKVFRKHV